MFAVVEDKQRFLAVKTLDDRIQERCPRGLLDSQGFGNRRDHTSTVGQRSQLDKPDAILGGIGQRGANLQGQSGLASTANPGDRQ